MEQKLKYPELTKKWRLLSTVGGDTILKGQDDITDEQIDQQIQLLLDQKRLDFNEVMENYFKSNWVLNLSSAKLFVKQSYGWEHDYNPDVFWNGGSVAFMKKYFNKKYTYVKGALGWDDLFTDDIVGNWSACDRWHQLRNIFNVEGRLNDFLTEKENKNKLKSQDSYMFNTADEYLNAIENAKKTIVEDAQKYYLDPKNPIETRVKLFEELGKQDYCIFQPTNKRLREIFDYETCESDMYTRHEIVSCVGIIDSWLERLVDTRVEIDYSENEYHPKLKCPPRNYVASEEAIQRLRAKYFNLLVVDGVSKFELDW